MGLIRDLRNVFLGTSNDLVSGEGLIVDTATYDNGFSFDSEWVCLLDAYKKCPPLSAIINSQADTLTSGKTWITKRSGKNKDEELFTSDAEKIRKLLESPNPDQTGNMFLKELDIYISVFGWCVVYIKRSVGFKENIDAASLHILPSHLVRFEYNDGFGALVSGSKIKKVYFTNIDNNGNRTESEISVKDIYLFRDTIPSFDSCGVLPMSRLRTIEQPISNIIDALESRSVLLRNRGMQGILTNRTTDSNSYIPISPDEKRDVLRDVKQTYGLLKHQFHLAIVNKDLQFQRTTLPTKDLMLIEEDENSRGKICDAFKFPKEMLSNDGKGTTFSNFSVATRNYYQNNIIPRANNIYDQFNKMFNTIKLDILIEKDFSEEDALQEDAKLRAEATLRMNQANQIAYRNNIIDKNTWRRDINLDPREDFVEVWYSDERALLDGNGVNIENDNVEDNLNPRTENNDGTPKQQA